MGRKPKYPEHKQQADKLMNELLDGVVDIWTGIKEPQLGTVADELEMSAAKVRKLLITAGERDGKLNHLHGNNLPGLCKDWISNNQLLSSILIRVKSIRKLQHKNVYKPLKTLGSSGVY